MVDQRKNLKDGLFVDDQKLTVGEFVTRWFDDVKSPLLRPSTLISHRSIIKNHIMPDIGYIRLRDLSPAHLQALYTNRLKSGLSKRTVKYIHTIMHQSLGQAMKWGLVARNVADAVESPVPDRKPVEPLTMAQVGMLFEILKNDRLYPLYVVFLGCGLRRGEALALTWDSVDLDNGIISVKKSLQHLSGQQFVIGEPKSEKSRRVIAMPDFVRNTLIDHRARLFVESEYVFCTSKGTAFVPRNIVRHFKNTLRKAGLPETIRLHDLRHTFVSYLLSQNVPPKDVQEIAGHSTFSVTMDIYGHLMPGAYQEAAKKMDKFFDGVP